MSALLTPRRRRGAEHIDDPSLHPELLRRSLRDVVVANALFGGARAALTRLDALLRQRSGGTVTMLDVGTGLGDLPRRARALAERRGVSLSTFGVDSSEVLARAGRDAHLPVICGDALRLPVRDAAADVVLCSQLLHHFEEREAGILLRELSRAAREMVIVADLRRSWGAAALFWLVSWPLRFQPVTRHDGTLSVLRGFTSDELRSLIQKGVGIRPEVRRHAGFRLSATWKVGGVRQ